MKENLLVMLSKQFAVDIIRICAEMIDEEEYQTLFSGCSKLRVLLIKSINTAKKKET